MKRVLTNFPNHIKGLALVVTLTLAIQLASAQKIQVLDNCDALGDGANAWKGPAISVSTEKKEGKGALQSTGFNIVPFNRVYATPFNTGVTKENGHLAFFLFIENTELLKGTGAIQLSSAAKASEDVYSINIGDLKVNKVRLVNGWNHVVVPLSSITTVVGTPDLSKINYFRIVLYNKAGLETPQTFKLDDIRFSSDPTLLAEITVK